MKVEVGTVMDRLRLQRKIEGRMNKKEKKKETAQEAKGRKRQEPRACSAHHSQKFESLGWEFGH